MTQTTIELAIKSLETKEIEIQNAISTLKAQMSGSAAIEETPTIAKGGVPAAPVKNKKETTAKDERRWQEGYFRCGEEALGGDPKTGAEAAVRYLSVF